MAWTFYSGPTRQPDGTVTREPLFTINWKRDKHQKRDGIDARHQPLSTVPTPGERIKDAILVGFGFLVRWAFFITSGVVLLVYCSEADWSAFNTRFAELTITKVFGAFAQLTIVTLLGVGMMRWAFSSGPKKYRSWAKFVFWTCVWGVTVYVVFFGKR